MVSIQLEEHDDVKFVMERELLPLLMLTEVGKLTSKDLPEYPATVKESALAPVTGQSVLVDVAGPSGGTVIVCEVVEERQIVPKSSTALESCTKDICGAMETVIVTGRSVQLEEVDNLYCT